MVYTTGQDGIYPAGLRIGEIVEVITGTATTPHRIFIPSRCRAGLNARGSPFFLYEPPVKSEFEQKLPKCDESREKIERLNG
jgi:hypothetical protein